MRLSLLRWAFLAVALATVAAGDAAAQSYVTASTAPSYGYGGSGAPRAAGPVVDLRRSAPPDQAALADDPDDDAVAADADADADADNVDAASAGQGTQPAPGQRQTLLAYRDDSLSGPSPVAAHGSLPIPSLVDVSKDGRFALVRVERRGRDDGRLALSPQAADALGVAPGVAARVEVRYLGPAPGAVAVAQAESGPASLLPPGAQPPDPSSPVPARQAPPPQAPARQPAAATASPSFVRQAWAAPPPASYAPPAPYGGYMVQVGAFAAPANAHRARAALLSQGPVVVEPRMVRGVELYRVRLGPWPDRGRAELARRRAAGLGFHDAIITPR